MGKGGRARTPERTRRFEGEIAKHAMIAKTRSDWTLTGAPIELSCWFNLPQPKDRRDDPHPTKQRDGDLSNLIKTVEDGCNGVLWEDDGQIIEYDTMRIKWAISDPGIRIVVKEIQHHDDISLHDSGLLPGRPDVRRLS